MSLSAVNKGRVKLLNANKITMYVKEDVYLATKREERDTDLDFVKLMHHEHGTEWDNDFNISSSYHIQNYRRIRLRWEENFSK